MCLITKQMKPKVATTDIPVWKILMNGNQAKIFDFTYEKGVLNKTRLNKVNKLEHASLFESKGWKSMNGEVGWKYTEAYGNWKIVGHSDRDNLTCIGKGFHAITKKKTAESYCYRNYNNVVVKFIIPKGAKYYTDVADCIVSNQIIMQ